MPAARSSRPPDPLRHLTPAGRRAHKADLRRLLAGAAWKEAVNIEAWRAVRAEGGNRCGPEEYRRAEAAVIASGYLEPSAEGLDEARIRVLLGLDRAAPAHLDPT